VFANINHPRDKDKIPASNDWFSGFKNGNKDTALQKKEGLWRARPH
jgi:hypothetical protein